MRSKTFFSLLFFITLYAFFMFFSIQSFAEDYYADNWSLYPSSYMGMPLKYVWAEDTQSNPLGGRAYAIYGIDIPYLYFYSGDYIRIYGTSHPFYVLQFYAYEQQSWVQSYQPGDVYSYFMPPKFKLYRNDMTYNGSLPEIKVTASILTFSKSPFAGLGLVKIYDNPLNHYDYYELTVSGSKKTESYKFNYLEYGKYLTLQDFCNFGEVIQWKLTPYKGKEYGNSYVGIINTGLSSLTKFTGTPVVPTVSTTDGKDINVVGEGINRTYIVQNNSKTDFTYTENNTNYAYQYYVLNTTTNNIVNNTYETVTYETINNIVNNTENITNNNQQYITNYYITYNYNYGYGGGTGGADDPDNPFGEIDIGSFLRNFKSTFDSSFADLVDRTNFLLSIGVQPRLVSAFISLFAFIVVAIIVGIVLTLFGR